MQSQAALPTRTGPDVAHPCKRGDTVSIISLAVFGRPYIEEHATIEGPYLGIPNLYYVRFVGDVRVRERYTHPEYQDNPERMVSIMLDMWRASLIPEILTEFFPDDL